MKLWILRHARAEDHCHSGRDRDRVLAEPGRRACLHLNHRLSECALPLPRRVLVSPAARTMETAQLTLAGLDLPDPQSREELWLADTSELQELITRNDDVDEAGLMLIGHNPGLEDLLRRLGANLPVPGLKPGTLVILELDWPLQTSRAKTLYVVEPNEST
jgi:phosphohistidine phosphatase